MQNSWIKKIPMKIVQMFILRNPIKPLQRVFAGQFGNPKGLLGHMFARLMNKSNLALNSGVISKMALEPGHRALDIGFGGGVGLRLMLDRASGVKVVGVDMSPDMVSKAYKTFSGDIGSGRLSLMEGVAENLPLESSSIDRACTVNTIYFWQRPENAFEEILRVLRPGGRLVLGMRPRKVMEKIPIAKHGFTLYDPEDLVRMMDGAGFRDTSFILKDEDGIGYFCITGRKP